MYRCYLFDFDYTLVDSTEGIVGCFQRTLREMGRPPLPAITVRRTIGLPMAEAVGTLLETKDEAVIEVQDSGSGISPQDLPHVFDRFYRADESRARVTGGRGVGLSIARAVVEAHGGTIGVESESGVGSCFTVTLPAIEGRTT